MTLVLISAIALALVSATMLARANDLGWRPGAVWHFRRLGFILAGFAPWGIVYSDFKSGGELLSLYEVLFRVGISFVFVTTPHLPPWWKWITGRADIDNPLWADDRRGEPRFRSLDEAERRSREP